MTNWRKRVLLAELLIELIRKYIVPEGHNFKYALKLPVLDRVNYLNLKNAPELKGDWK
jgi:hypothetical protein